ncbi:hypothetical protein BGZ60DRAFT_526353 [Tricladium varicosporioides]|nr:hypothetical protein BGZ60DRAFT_526353 [Hymenoscyphus varicosporioides]
MAPTGIPSRSPNQSSSEQTTDTKPEQPKLPNDGLSEAQPETSQNQHTDPSTIKILQQTIQSIVAAVRVLASKKEYNQEALSLKAGRKGTFGYL